MIAFAESRTHDADRHRFAHQELFRAFPGLVIIIVNAVVGGLIVVVALGLAADRQRNVAHFISVIGVFIVRIQHVEGIARLHFALEVDVVRVDANQFLDNRRGHVVAQSRFVDALIEPHSAAIVFAAVVPPPRRCRRRRCGCRPQRRCRGRTAPPPPRPPVSPAMMTRSGCMCPRPAAAVRTRSFWPSFNPPSRARAPSTARIPLISSGAAPSSRRIEPTVSPFFATTTCSLQSSPPVVFGRSVIFSGTTRASNPTYGSVSPSAA